MSIKVDLLVGYNNGRFPSSNCLLVKSIHTKILVDAGCREDQILESKDKIDAVVYTHIHPDHITLHPLLQGVKSVIPEYDAQYTTLVELAKRFTPPIWRDWIEYVENVFHIHTIPEASETYRAWDTIRVGDLELEAIPAYGHTRGHHILVIGNHIHVSDIDLTRFGPWYGHPESSLTGFINDLIEASSIQGSYYTTSHKGTVYTQNRFRRELINYVWSLCRQLRIIANYVDGNEPVKPFDMANRGLIYKKKPDAARKVMEYFEGEIIMKILDYLSVIGLLEKTREGYVVREDLMVLDEKCLELSERVHAFNGEG